MSQDFGVSPWMTVFGISPWMTVTTVLSRSQTGTGGSSLSGPAPPECQGPHLFAGTLQALCQANRGLFTDGHLPVAQQHLKQKYGPCVTHIRISLSGPSTQTLPFGINTKNKNYSHGIISSVNVCAHPNVFSHI